MVPSLKRETSGGSESSDTEAETELEEGVSSGNDTSEDSSDVSEGEADGSSQTLQRGRKGARKRGREESQMSATGREVGRLSTRKRLQLESAFVETLSATSHSTADQKAAKVGSFLVPSIPSYTLYTYLSMFPVEIHTEMYLSILSYRLWLKLYGAGFRRLWMLHKVAAHSISSNVLHQASKLSLCIADS